METKSNELADRVLKTVNESNISTLELILEFSEPDYVHKSDVIDFIKTYIITIKKRL